VKCDVTIRCVAELTQGGTVEASFTKDKVADPNGTDLIKYEDILYQTPQDVSGTPNTKVAGQVVSGLPAGPVLVKLLDLRQSPGEFFDQGVGFGTGSR
jgi:hypothetical protein